MITKSVVRLTLKIFRPQEDKKRKPRFVIGPKSIVVDGMAFEKKVDLFISESTNVGGVKGVMSMEDAVRFSGDKP